MTYSDPQIHPTTSRLHDKFLATIIAMNTSWASHSYPNAKEKKKSFSTEPVKLIQHNFASIKIFLNIPKLRNVTAATAVANKLFSSLCTIRLTGSISSVRLGEEVYFISRPKARHWHRGGGQKKNTPETTFKITKYVGIYNCCANNRKLTQVYENVSSLYI